MSKSVFFENEKLASDTAYRIVTAVSAPKINAEEQKEELETLAKTSRPGRLSRTPRVPNFHKQGSADLLLESSDDNDSTKKPTDGQPVSIENLSHFYQALIKDSTGIIAKKIANEAFDKSGKQRIDYTKIEELYKKHKQECQTNFIYNEECPDIVKSMLKSAVNRFFNIHLKQYIQTSFNEAIKKESNKKEAFLAQINDITNKAAVIRPDYEILSLLQNNVYNNRDIAIQMYAVSGYASVDWSLNAIEANAATIANKNGHKQSRFNNLTTSIRENFGENFGSFLKSLFPFAMIDGNDFQKIKALFKDSEWNEIYKKLDEGKNPFDSNNQTHRDFIRQIFKQHVEVYQYYKNILDSDFYGILHGKTFPTQEVSGRTNNPNILTQLERTMARISIKKILKESYDYSVEILGANDARKILGKDEVQAIISKTSPKPIWQRVKEALNNHNTPKQQASIIRNHVKLPSIKNINFENGQNPDKFTKEESKNIRVQAANGTLRINTRSPIKNVQALIALKNDRVALEYSDEESSSPRKSSIKAPKKEVKATDDIAPAVSLRKASVSVPIATNLDKAKESDESPVSSNTAISRLLVSKSTHRTLIANGQLPPASPPRLLTRAEYNQTLADEKATEVTSVVVTPAKITITAQNIKSRPQLTRQNARVWSDDDLKKMGVLKTQSDLSRS